MILCSEDSETDDGMFLYSRDRNVQILCSLLYKLQAALVDIQISVKRIAVDVGIEYQLNNCTLFGVPLLGIYLSTSPFLSVLCIHQPKDPTTLKRHSGYVLTQTTFVSI